MAILRSDLLEGVRSRRFDAETRTRDLTDSFGNTSLSQSTRYIYESMRVIDQKYRDMTLSAIEHVKSHISRNWNTLNSSVDIRQQGSVTTFTEIEATSDADLLIIQNDFYRCNGHKASFPYGGSTSDLMGTWKNEIAKELDRFYNSVKEKPKCVLVDMQNPKRKIDVVPVAWYKREGESKLSKHVGISTYNNGSHHNDSFPFLVTDSINSYGKAKADANRRLIRYIKSIKADSEGRIRLTSFEIYSFINDFVEDIPWNANGLPLSLYLKRQVDLYLSQLKNCESIQSPCASETPFHGNRQYFEEQFGLLSSALTELHSKSEADKYYNPELFEKGIIYG